MSTDKLLTHSHDCSLKESLLRFTYNHNYEIFGNKRETTEYGTVPNYLVRSPPKSQRIFDALSSYKCIFIVAVVILLLISSQFAINYYLNQNNIIVCNTTECLRTASSYKLTMDDTINPCDDFYAYACGHWKDEYNFAPIQSSSSSFSLRQDKMDYKIRNFLMKNNSDDDLAGVKQSRSFLKSCLNVKQQKKLGVSAIFKHLRNAHLPVIPRFFKKSRKSAPFNWIEANVNLKKYFNMDLFIGMEVDSNLLLENYDQNVLYIQKPSDDKILPRPFDDLSKLYSYKSYVEDEDEQIYKNTISSIIGEIIGKATKTPVHKKVIDNATNIIFDVWTNLESLKDFNRTRSVKLLLKDLQKETDYYFLVNNHTRAKDIWEPYLTLLFHNFPNDTFSFEDDYIYTTDEDLDYLNRVVYTLQSYPDDVLELYSWWSAVKIMAFYAIPNVQYDKMKECLTLTANNFFDAVIYGLVDDKFLSNTKPKVEMMLEEIKLAFIENIENSEWLDEYSKQAVIQKIKSITALMGISEEWIDKEEMNKRANSLTIKDDTYLDNLMECEKGNFPELLESLRTNTQYLESSFQVNAFNYQSLNFLYIYFSILDVPFYNLGLEVLNYGATGSIIGHELLHAFDTDGISVDQFKAMRQWLEKDITDIYKNRTQCLVEQYNSFYEKPSGKNVIGEKHLSENIADNEGLRQTYFAFKNYERENKLETGKKLPGFGGFTNDQLFFLAFAQNFCEDPVELDTSYDTHSPNKFRVIGSLQNSEEFSEAFKCKRGTYMNPDKTRCILW